MKTVVCIPVLLTACICLIFSSSCTVRHRKAFPKLRFQTALLLPHTPVKDQGGWPAGWIYATLALIESERILAGDSLELSGTYLIRKYLEEKANDNQHDSTFNGTPFSCLRLLERQGLLTYQCYRCNPTMKWSDFRHIASRKNLQSFAIQDSPICLRPSACMAPSTHRTILWNHFSSETTT